MSLPVWAFFAFVGIVISAFMTIRTGKEERRIENESIELEGKIYMERIEEARLKRKRAQ
ncbi:sporulation YhaL family protein [Bacillus sp. Bva_UNVM-123]|uniref:sporulation YhaL family protein n=1 Tax=Bacillus sp. Bva_UNVM-123 TaxID=2829798 RepID=UPI00391F2702